MAAQGTYSGDRMSPGDWGGGGDGVVEEQDSCTRDT